MAPFGAEQDTAIISAAPPATSYQSGAPLHQAQGEALTPLNQQRGVPLHTAHQAAQPRRVKRVATSDTLSMSERSMFLKVLQQCIGDFPSIELRGMAERPEDLRKWKYAVATSLEAAGPQFKEWWTWSITTADLTHRPYAHAPIMNREGIAVEARTPMKFVQLESWIRPKLIACLPQALKRTLTQRGTQGVKDECQDILCMLFKSCMPGAADEKIAVLKMLQNPTPCSTAETALNEMQRFWSAGRRFQELNMAPPDVTVPYTAFRSIFSDVLTSAGSNLRLRWMNLENVSNLFHIISIESMYEVAKFADGELPCLVTLGTNTGNPGLPLTDSRKRQEAEKKNEEEGRTDPDDN